MPESPKPPEVWWNKQPLPDRILPDPESPATPSESPRKVWTTTVSVVLILLRLGLGLMGIIVNLWLGIFVMFVAFCLSVYAFWTWPGVSRWAAFWRLAIILIAASIYFGLIGVQADRQYKKTHPPNILLDRIHYRYIICRYGENHVARLSVRTMQSHMGAAPGQHGRTESLPEVQESVLEQAASGSQERQEVQKALTRTDVVLNSWL